MDQLAPMKETEANTITIQVPVLTQEDLMQQALDNERMRQEVLERQGQWAFGPPRFTYNFKP